MQLQQIYRLVIVLIVLMGAARESRTQSNEALLDSTVALYQNAASFWMARTSLVELTAGERSQAMELEQRAAEHQRGGLLIDVKGGPAPMRIVSNGDTTWFQDGNTGAYMKRFGGLRPGADRADVPDFFGPYKRLNEDVRAIRDLGKVWVTFNTDSVQARHLSILQQDNLAYLKGDSTVVNVWIDEDTYRIMHDVTVQYIRDSPFGGAAVIRQTNAYTVMDMQQAPDSLFSFQPAPEDPLVQVLPGLAAFSSTLKGRPVVNFSLESNSGVRRELASLEGKVILLNFWATWCGPCRAEMDALENLHQTYADSGLVVLAINHIETPREALEYITEEGYTFEVLYDYLGEVSALYQVNSIPTTLVINRRGVISDHFLGAREEADFLNGILDAGLLERDPRSGDY